MWWHPLTISTETRKWITTRLNSRLACNIGSTENAESNCNTRASSVISKMIIIGYRHNSKWHFNTLNCQYQPVTPKK
jgi:hypothetical protein